MKYNLIFLIVMPILSYGQLLSNSNKLTVYDTVATIKIIGVSNKTIQINTTEFLIYFDKEIAYTSIQNYIEEIENSDDLKDWQLHAIDQLKQVGEYIRNENTITIRNFWNNESNNLDHVQDGLTLTKRYFWELACPMIDSGQFELILEKEHQTKIYKTTSEINGAIATVYVSEEQNPIWICPPIIVD